MTCQSVTANYSFVYAGTNLARGFNTFDVFGGNTTDRIISMNSTIGLGSESSTLNFTIAGQPGNNAFGISPENNVGRAAIFKCNGFTFGGMIKSLSNSEDDSGNTTKVNMTCAKELLAKYDLLLNKSACSFDKVRTNEDGSLIVRSRSNINGKNIHADLEEFSIQPQFCGTKGAIGYLLPNKFDCSKYGAANEGIVARGSTTYKAIIDKLYRTGVRIFTIYNADLIRVNFSPIKNIVRDIPYASTSAYKMTLLELINSICDEAGYDFHCSMNGSWITFNLVNKRVESVFGSVKNIIEKAKNDNKCISSSIGAEFKNEKTNRVVSGPYINYIKELYTPGDAHASLVLGFSGQTPIRADNPDFIVPFDTSPLSQSMAVAGIGGFPLSVPISERELIACGTLDTWKLWGLENPYSLSRQCLLYCYGQAIISNAISLIRRFGNTHYVARAAVEAVKMLGEKGISSGIYEEICWPFFRSIYETYYGKYYLITMLNRQTCFQDPTGYVGNTGIFLGEGGAGTLMDQPTSSGWPDNESRVIGTEYLSMFFDSSGKLGCFVGIPWNHTLSRNFYTSSLDIASFTGDNFYDESQGMFYAKCDVDGRAYNINGNLGILLRMPSMITQKVNLSNVVNNNGLRAISLCLGSPLGGFGSGAGTTNTSYVNIFKENRAAGGFTRVAIPMRNNQITYGPWKGGRTGGGTGGGVDIQIREDLTPWQYGSYDAMNDAGDRLSGQGLPSRTKYESGHVTIAESPTESLGSRDSGPLLASIVVKFDKGGSTTTYNYETYKPKFGNYAENFNEYTKKTVADRRDNFNILRETYLESIRNSNDALRTVNSIRERIIQEVQHGAGSSSASSRQILIVSHPDPFQGQLPASKIDAGSLKAYDSDIFQDPYQYIRYAAVGMDMLYSPVSINESTSYMANMMPGYAESYSNRFLMGPIDRMPPYLFNGRMQGASHITNMVLNPYTTRANVEQFFTGRGFSFGFQSDYITFGSNPKNMLDLDNAKQDSSSVRGVAHRGPLLLHGWGYDVDGKPVPNQNPQSPTQNFSPGWLANPRSWPVGPVDLRWDHRRGVWVSPPSERLVVAQLLGDLRIGGRAEAVIISQLYNDTFADDGTRFSTVPSLLGCDELSTVQNNYPKITVADLVARPANIGSRIVGYHVGGGVYIPLMIADTYKKETIAGCCSSQQSDGANDPNNPCFTNEQSPCKENDLVYQTDFSRVMVEGLRSDGTKVLHDLVATFVPPDIYNDRGSSQVKVLAYSSKNDLGFPCMTGVPIVDCTGEYPGGGEPPI